MQLIKQRPNSNTSEEDNLAAVGAQRGAVKGSAKLIKSVRNRNKDSWSNSDFEKMFEAIDADEIKRQKNSRALRRHLKEIANDWDNEVNDLNTLRRNKVLKELHNYLKNTIDLVRVKPEEIGIQVEVALRQALDAHFETMSNLNLGQMYVPMEDNPSNSKAVSRENTDYDTFGSIDSLIFEPKIPTHEDIKEAQEEIEQQFEYLDHIGVDESVYDDITPTKRPEDIVGPGKTTFAERVKLFQKLGKKEQESNVKRNTTPVQRPAKRITTLEVSGQETTWRELAKAKDAQKLGNEALRMIENTFGARSSRLERKEESESEDEFSSVCPDCQNVPHHGDESFGTLACSSCDCCTQCDVEEEEERKRRAEYNPYHNSNITGSSWDFEKPALPAKQDRPRQHPIVNNAVLAKSTIDDRPAPVVGNLRQKLKEAFGANIANHLTDLTVDQSSDQQSYYEPMMYGSSSVERDVDHQEDFLIEYGKKQNLVPPFNFDEEDVQSVGGSSSAVLLRDGRATQLTEEMFRGDFIHGSKSKSSNKKSLVASSDMDDSGIASPFRNEAQLSSFQAQSQVAVLAEEAVGGDSGLEEGGKTTLPTKMIQPPEPPPMPAPPSISSGTLFLITPRPTNPAAPPFKKRDTMIRELKSKLKEKFSLDSSSTSSSENSSLQKLSSYRQAAGDIQGGVVPRLSKVFESRRIQLVASNNGTDKSSSTETSIIDPSMSVDAQRPSDQASASTPPPGANKRDSPLSPVRESPSNSSASVSTVKEKSPRRRESPAKNFPEDLPQRELTASPLERRELLYGPGGLFGPKGPFSTPSVRYPFGMEVGLAPSPKRNVHFEPNPNRPQMASRASKKSTAISSEVSSAAEDRSDKSHYVVVNDVMTFQPRTSRIASPVTVDSKPSSRIEMYQTDWVEAAEAAHVPRVASPSKSSQQQWKEEKNKRMLAWVKNSHVPGILENDQPFLKVKFRTILHKVHRLVYRGTFNSCSDTNPH